LGLLEKNMDTKAQSYAGLLPRLLAFALDYLILGGYLLLLLWVGVTLIGIFPGFSERVSANPLLGQLLGFVTVTLPVSLYFASAKPLPVSPPGASAACTCRLSIRLAPA